MSEMVDLRSDTVTRPTPAMRRAMAEAEVGDDVYGEDPTVNKLQDRVAELFEREAALFVPSGSMGNLICVRIHADHGSEVICESRGHTFNFENASLSAIAGCLPRSVETADGVMAWSRIEPVLPPKVYYRAQAALIVLENTHNMAGGTIFPLEVMEDVCDQAHQRGIPVHLDGARIFNAAAATGRSVAELTRKVNSVMFCISKGLGAPVGSLILGSKEFIEQARVFRKMFGGGMRQAGVLAAAGLVALDESPPKLHEDHRRARRLAEGLQAISGIGVIHEVQTNIVIFNVMGTGMDAGALALRLKEQGVLMGALDSSTLRAVTHYDVDDASIDRSLKATRELVGASAKTRA